MTNLTRLGDDRGKPLLAALDERFLSFVSRLNGPLRTHALRRSTYTNEPGAEAFGGPSTMNPGVTLTPWLFWELTSPLDDASFLSLAEGGSMVVISSALLDHLVDGQAVSPEDTLLLHRLLHERGIATLRACLGGGSPFWRTAERLIAEHLEGLALERGMRAALGAFSYPDFQRMVKAKFSPIVLTMSAYLTATERGDLQEPIENSIKHLAVASQLLDDLGDWEEDMRGGRLTYFLSCAVAPREAARLEAGLAEEVEERIRSSWLDVDHLNLAAEWLDRARASVEGIPCPNWIEYLEGFRSLTLEHIRQSTAGHLVQTLDPLVARGAKQDPGELEEDGAV